MSLLSRLFNLIRSPVRFVGRDLEGNSFYERPGIDNDPRRTKRTVQYKNSEDVWKYIGGGKRLPVQWSMWLSHTRRNPPTLQELQQDLERQKRVLANAALIEARDLEERRERLRIDQNLKEENASRKQIEQSQAPPESPNGTSDGATEKLPPAPTRPADEPESWSPQTIRRGN